MTYNDRLFSLEKRDGVSIIESTVANNYNIGIKEEYILMLSQKNGEFCADAMLMPYIIKELAEVYNTYFAKDGEQIKVLRKKKK